MPAPAGVTIWDVETGLLLRTLGKADLIARSFDGALLAAAQFGTKTLWIVQTEEPLTIMGERTRAASLAYSLDRARLATGGGKTITPWDAQTGERLRSLVGTGWRVIALGFSPDGALLASATSDNTVTLWNVQSGRAVKTIKGHNGSVKGLAFSPEGSLLVSCTLDGTIILWEPGS